jgi:hypothetical protein
MDNSVNSTGALGTGPGDRLHDRRLYTRSDSDCGRGIANQDYFRTTVSLTNRLSRKDKL